MIGSIFGGAMKAPAKEPANASAAAPPQRVGVKRTVLAADLKTARHLHSVFTAADPPTSQFDGTSDFRRRLLRSRDQGRGGHLV
jgi:hypothetical protein